MSVLVSTINDIAHFFTCGCGYASDYIEKEALSLGLGRLFLLTTRTADWYVPISSSWRIYSRFHIP